MSFFIIFRLIYLRQLESIVDQIFALIFIDLLFKRLIFSDIYEVSVIFYLLQSLCFFLRDRFWKYFNHEK